MKSKKLVLLLIVLVYNLACTKPQEQPLKYLALGDSYTIGEAVPENGRWPVQLVDSLQSHGIEMNKPTIVATTGWTTNELQKGIEEVELAPPYDLVSLLIGVNNQYRGYDIEIYREEFRALIEKSIEFAGGDATKVFVVSIPNYGVTPFGMQKGEEQIRTELLAYDAMAAEIASEYNIPFINITPISEGAKTDSTLIASDELHPSAKQYTLWVEEILPIVKSKISEY